MKKWLKRLKKDERGLTLVELLAVVVILAIVAAIAFVMVGKVIENSKKDAHIANAQQIISAVKLADASNDVTWTEDSTVNVIEADLDTIGEVLDPWEKKPYTTVSVEKEDNIYSITLAGTGTAEKCEISEKSETDLQGDRDDICE